MKVLECQLFQVAVGLEEDQVWQHVLQISPQSIGDSIIAMARR
jgi:hypothetical protein